MRLRVECSQLPATDGIPEYVKTVSARMPLSVTHKQVLRKVCGCIETEALFHEDSEFVASSVRAAVERGAWREVPANTLLALQGCDAPQLRIAVGREVLLENVHVVLGRLNISTALEPGTAACPAYTYSQTKSSMQLDVPAVQITCLRGDVLFGLSLRLTPCLQGALFSQCFSQVGDVCSPEERQHRLEVSGVAPTMRAMSHQEYRGVCHERHQRDIAETGGESTEGVAASSVLDKWTSVLSSVVGGGGKTRTVHTVLFR